MVNVTNTTQYSTFETLRDIIQTDATLLSIFPDTKIIEFDVKLKDTSAPGFPYIILRTPSSDTEELTINKSDSNKIFTVILEMRNDYFARSSITSYINKLIRAIEDGSETLLALGYKLMTVDNLGTNPSLISQKDIFQTRIRIVMEGLVNRR